MTKTQINNMLLKRALKASACNEKAMDKLMAAEEALDASDWVSKMNTTTNAQATNMRVILQFNKDTNGARKGRAER